MASLEALRIGAACCFYIYASWYLARLIIRDHKARQAATEHEKLEKKHFTDYVATPSCVKQNAEPDPEDTKTDRLAPCPICHSEVSAELEQWPGFKKLTITCDRCGLSFENSQDFRSYTTPGGKIRYVATSEDPIIMWNRVAEKSSKQPETVRCKDCIYNKHRTEGNHVLNWCGKFDNVMRPSDFCSFGEKPAYERRADHE